jgi:hypothetical protein
VAPSICKKLPLTSPRNGGRTLGIVRSRTKATELLSVSNTNIVFTNKLDPNFDCSYPTHIFAKRKQRGIKFSQMYWLMGRQSELTIENKLLVYKAILKPIWTYGAPLWGSASTSNIEILQRSQNKVLRTIVNAP